MLSEVPFNGLPQAAFGADGLLQRIQAFQPAAHGLFAAAALDDPLADSGILRRAK